jgi:copper(I)-binding protein
MKTGIKLMTLLLAVVSACGCQPKKITIQQAWARPANAGENGAVYFVVDNPGSQNDEMVGVTCEAAQQAQMHLSEMDSNGVMTMKMQSSVPVPAQGQVEFKPGGYHIMLIGMKQNLAPGDTLHLAVTFKNAGQIALDVPVKEP